MVSSPPSSFLFLLTVSSHPKPGNPKLCLCLFCPATGCRHLYLTTCCLLWCLSALLLVPFAIPRVLLVPLLCFLLEGTCSRTGHELSSRVCASRCVRTWVLSPLIIIATSKQRKPLHSTLWRFHR